MKLDLPRASDVDAGVWFSTRASTRYPSHWHDELELNLVLCGRVQYEIASHTVELGPGSLLFLAPGQQHTLLGVSDDLAMWVAAFRTSAVCGAEALGGLRFLERRAWAVQRLMPCRALELSALLARLALHENPCQVKPRSRLLLASTLGYWHGHHVMREEPSASQARTSWSLHGAVARARMLLREPEGALSLAVLSRLCGLDAGRLSRLFKQQTGLSIVQYRNHFRVQRFISHFGHGDSTTMLGAALECGFGSYAQFHRAFHAVTGYAPSEHLRRVRFGIVVPVQQGLQLLDAQQ